jgi:hypothetical protein
MLSPYIAEHTASLCQETYFRVEYTCGQLHYRSVFHQLAATTRLCFASEKLITHVY